jgi:hypothetical protein
MNGIEMAAGGSFSVMERLLIRFSRIDPGERSFSLARETLSLHVNWDAFIRKSVQEGVAPLIYRNLRSLRGLVPGKALDDLGSVFYRNALRNERLYWTASALFRDIHRFGLRVAVTKGARLALTLYPDRGLRAFADIDLFVHPEDWPALRKILDEKGFEANSARQSRFDPRDRSLHWTFSPYYRLGDLLIELHFSYLGLHLPFLSEDDLWASAGTAKNGDIEIPVLSPEYELCYLCLHALQHSYSRLLWLTDIAEHASRGNVDWDRAAGICRAEGITAGVRHGLDLVNALYGLRKASSPGARSFFFLIIRPPFLSSLPGRSLSSPSGPSLESSSRRKLGSPNLTTFLRIPPGSSSTTPGDFIDRSN